MANWKGTTVPNSGTVEKVYFNTNLTVEEVYNLVNSIDYDLWAIGNYCILADENFDVQLLISTTNPSEAFVIQGSIGGEDVTIFSYNFLEESEGGNGWQTFNNPLTVNTTAISEVEEEGEVIPLGAENSKLSSLFSITPFEEEVTLEGFLTDCCDAVREKEGTTDKILALDIPSRIRALSSGGIEGIIEVEELPLLPSDIDTSKIYYLNRRVSDIYAFMGDSWISMKNMIESNGGKFDVIVVKDKPTENIKVSDPDIPIMCGYFVENENDIFLYIDGTGEGNPSWVSLSEAFFGGDATYGGHITDVSEATDPTKYYTNAVQTFYKYSNGWIEYKYGGIVPSGRHTITSNGVYDISDYASVDVNVSTSQEDGLVGKTLTTYTNDRVTSIGRYAFYTCTNLTSVDLPNATSIGEKAFYSCGALTSINLPNVTSIGEYAFGNCGALTSINLPKVTSIENYVFENCSSLISVDLPNATSIGRNAFHNCSKLTSVDLPNATSIGSSAFESCYSLTKLIIRTTSQTCTLSSTSAFSSCYHILGTTNATYNPEGLKDGYIYVPDELVESYKTATNWSEYASQIKPLSEYVEG